LSAACLAGYVWLYVFQAKNAVNFSGVELCLFKHFTGLPCPSCGSTRSVLQLFQGNLREAFLFNPIGYVIFIVLLIVPLWIIFDVIFAKPSLFIFYQNAECFIKRKVVAIPLIFIVLLNWIWNIHKGF
jgi:hypothetical protein